MIIAKIGTGTFNCLYVGFLNKIERGFVIKDVVHRNPKHGPAALFNDYGQLRFYYFNNGKPIKLNHNSKKRK